MSETHEPCRSCRMPVSILADACPYCQKTNPTSTSAAGAALFSLIGAALVGLAFGIRAIFKASSQSDGATQKIEPLQSAPLDWLRSFLWLVVAVFAFMALYVYVLDPRKPAENLPSSVQPAALVATHFIGCVFPKLDQGSAKLAVYVSPGDREPKGILSLVDSWRVMEKSDGWLRITVSSGSQEATGLKDGTVLGWVRESDIEHQELRNCN